MLARLLRPTSLKIGLLVILFLIVWAGHIQSWAFAEHIDQKPALYDVLSPIPIWPFTVLILMPLLIISSPLMIHAGIDVTALNTWYSILIVGVYLYFVDCFIAELADFIKRKFAA